MSYKNVGAHPEDTEKGQVIGPGEDTGDVSFDDTDPHNQRLVDEGIFIQLESPKSSKSKKEG